MKDLTDTELALLGVDRRQFLKNVGAVAASGLAGGILAGCGGNNTSSRTSGYTIGDGDIL